MRGVSPLASSFFEIPLLTQLCHKQLEEAVLGLMFNQASPKLGEHAEIEARIGQLQSEQIFDIHARAYCICCLTVCQLFHVPHKTNQGQSPRGFCWLPSLWEEINKLV